MSLDVNDEKSTLDQVMAWCRQATSNYLSQCWPRPLLPYDVIRPQWVIWRKTTKTLTNRNVNKQTIDKPNRKLCMNLCCEITFWTSSSLSIQMNVQVSTSAATEQVEHTMKGTFCDTMISQRHDRAKWTLVNSFWRYFNAHCVIQSTRSLSVFTIGCEHFNIDSDI